MNNAFKKMTRAIAWVATASLTLGFAMMPTGAAAYQSFPTPARYEFVSQNGTDNGVAHVVNANAGDTIAMSLTLKNRQIDPAALVFYGKSELLPEAAPYRGAHELRLGVKNDAVLSWIDASSFIANPDGASNRLAVYDGPKVNPGETLTFSFNLKIAAGTANATYDLPIGVVREYDSWLKQVKNGKVLPSADIYWRVVVGGGSALAPTGGLSIALAGDTPASASIADAGNANFTKFTMSAAAGATVSISQIYVTRDGLSTDSQMENVKILNADGVQIGGTAGGFNAAHKAQVYITPSYALTGTQSFYIRAGIVNSTTGGVTIKLGVANNSDIFSNATSVTGAPVWGNAMTCVQVTIGTVTVAEDYAIADGTPDVGDKDVDVNPFTILAGTTEAIVVDRITVIKAGTSDVSDTNNIELWDVTHNVSLGTQAAWTGDGKASWPVNIALGQGDKIQLKIRLDIVDGVGLTVNVGLLDGSDTLIFAKGATYGFYITPTSGDAQWTNTTEGQGAVVQTINSGALVISKSGLTPVTGNIAIADGQLLTVFDFEVKGEPINISSTTIYCNINDAGAADYGDMTTGRLVDMATGSSLAGPVDGADEADGATTTNLTTAVDAKFLFASTISLPVGITKIGFKVRINTTDWADADTVNAIIDKAADVVSKGVITNNTITATGSYSVTGNTQTIKAGALKIETLGIPATGSIVVNTQDMVIGTYSFNAVASGEDVRVTTFTVTDDVDASTGEMDDFTNMELWADLITSGTGATSPRGDAYETKISSTEQPASAAGTDGTQAFTLTTVLEIAKGTSVKVAVVADVASGATALGTHIIETSNGTCAAVNGKATGSNIDETAAGLSTNATLTIAANGSLTSALAASSPIGALMIAGSSSYTTLGAFDLTASTEAYTVTKISLDLTAGWDSMNMIKISYPTKSAGTATREVSVSSAAILFDGIDMYVPKNGRATFTISGTTGRIGNSGNGVFHDIITLVFDNSTAAEFSAVGEGSGATLSGTDISDQTAETMYLYNSVPTVTAANPSGAGTISPGSVIDLYKFKVTADAAGDIAIKRFTFTVFITDASTTTASDADLATFTFLRDGVDITSTSQITDDTTVTLALTLEATNKIENNISTIVEVLFAAEPHDSGEQLISAGQTVTYTLRALAGTGFTTTDAISTTLDNDTAVVAADHFYLGDTDMGTGFEQDYGLTTVAEHTATAYKFIWSDRSTLIHLSTCPDTVSLATSSGDWAQGFLVKNFPLSGYGYTL